MSLYDSGTRRALGLAVLLTAAISLFDFGALAVLYPVFGTLATGGSGTASFGPAFLTSADPKTLLVIAMILMIGRSILGFGVRAWWGRQASRAEVGLSARLVGAYAYAPYSFHLSSNSSDLMARSVAHVNMASASGLMGLVTITADGASAIAMVSALFLASASTGLAISAFLVLVGAAVSFISRRYVQAQANTFSQEVTKVYGRAADVLRGIRELTVANGRSRALESMSESRE
jgi:ABC-type multidrug transport system fused ATPase/permease subunit